VSICCITTSLPASRIMAKDKKVIPNRIGSSIRTLFRIYFPNFLSSFLLLSYKPSIIIKNPGCLHKPGWGMFFQIRMTKNRLCHPLSSAVILFSFFDGYRCLDEFHRAVDTEDTAVNGQIITLQIAPLLGGV